MRANGCASAPLTVTILQKAALALTETHADVNCFGAATGTVDLSVSGGTSPYTYAWSNGAVTQDLAGLSAGPYTVTVTDANGCASAPLTVTILQKAALALTETHADVNCFGAATGTVDLSVSGGTSRSEERRVGGAGTQGLAGVGSGS